VTRDALTGDENLARILGLEASHARLSRAARLDPIEALRHQ